MRLTAEDYFFAQQAERYERELRNRWMDRLVVLRDGGRYDGRKGVVKGVQLDATKGRWTFLVMVLRVDGTDTLNTEPATRMYRPAWHFDATDERWNPTSRHGKNASLHDIWFGGEA